MPTPMHIVAACALITNHQEEILLVRHPRRGWEVPGGQIEEGESVVEGLQREIWEETGTLAEIGKMTGVYSNVTPPTKVIFAFQAAYSSGALTPSSESPEVRWFPRDQVLSLVKHAALHERISDMLSFASTQAVTYRVYTTEPYQSLSVRTI